MASKAHPGFEAVARKMAMREGVPMDRARAMLAASTRRASPAAKKANPALKKVAPAKKAAARKASAKKGRK